MAHIVFVYCSLEKLSYYLIAVRIRKYFFAVKENIMSKAVLHRQ